MGTSPVPAPVAQTHAVLFTLWFPIQQLSIPPQILPEIEAIASQVSAGMLDAFSQSDFLGVLVGMTMPNSDTLPFYECLSQSTNPWAKQFLDTPGGIGGMPVAAVTQFLSYLFEGECGWVSAMYAMLIREAYLSGIWDLPLAVPLTAIDNPRTFVDDIAIYSKLNYPVIGPNWLTYDSATKTISAKDGVIDYLVIGSGPGGATVATELQKAGKRVVLIEQGPFVVWGSMDTMSYSALMYKNNIAATSDNGVLVRSGQAMGGGTAVNIDLAFSPLEGTIQARIANWIEQGWIDGRFYTQERLAAAYQWVRNAIVTRDVTQCELNRDNRVLWDGAVAFGVNPSLYHLNRFQQDLSPSPVTCKRDAARQLIVGAMGTPENPLAVIPDMSVQEILFAPDGPYGGVRATGVSLLSKKPWIKYGNTVVDPCQLGIPPEISVSIHAENVILAAGTIGSSRILLNSAKSTPAIDNPRTGRGLIMHPSFPLIGRFNETINLLEGLDSATFLDAFGVAPGFIFETMSGLPAYGALLIPGSGEQVYNRITKFNQSAGFGVMLVDTPSDDNRVRLDDTGSVVLDYTLSEGDKQRFRTGVAIAIRMMFLAGAYEVIIPSNENFLGLEGFDPMNGVYLTSIEQADLVEKNLEFIPNRTLLTSAHLQASNKSGSSAATSVVSTRQRVWNVVTQQEIPNLYVMDSSMFPTSVGANPMQAIYTFAKIFSERLLGGMDEPAPLHFEGTPRQERRVLRPE
jgi:choline dehydrogenase-like flavoprotein